MPLEVSEAPIDELVVWERLQSVTLDHATPEIAFIRHRIGQFYGADWTALHAKRIGDLGPHMLPSEEAAISHIEDFACAAWLRGGPNACFRQEHRVNSL